MIDPAIDSSRSRKLPRRSLVVIGLIAAAALALVFLANIGGWKSRILARVLRVDNWPTVVSPPENFRPTVPPGFQVSLFASGFTEPRWLAVAPNGDVFVADSAVGEVVVLRDPERQGIAASREIFADHLNLPFGIAFHDDYVYVADTNEVLRFRYDPKTLKRLGDAQHILALPGMGYHQHWTRSLRLVQMGKNCLYRSDRATTFRSRQILGGPRSCCLIPKVRMFGFSLTECAMPLASALIRIHVTCGLL